MVGGFALTVTEGCVPPNTYEEGMPMITLDGFMAVISLVLTCIGLGYAIGSNTKNSRLPTKVTAIL